MSISTRTKRGTTTQIGYPSCLLVCCGPCGLRLQDLYSWEAVHIVTMSKYTYSTANLTDTELKEQGNRLFEQRKYDDAVSCYTKAIVSTLFKNISITMDSCDNIMVLIPYVTLLSFCTLKKWRNVNYHIWFTCIIIDNLYLPDLFCFSLIPVNIFSYVVVR